MKYKFFKDVKGANPAKDKAKAKRGYSTKQDNSPEAQKARAAKRAKKKAAGTW